MSLLITLKAWAKRLKKDVMTVYFAGKNPQTPFVLKLLAIFIAAYALSPIDLIPDFIPVIGYLDDLIIVPVGVYVILKYLPQAILTQARYDAQTLIERPSNHIAAGIIISVWLVIIILAGIWAYTRLHLA